MEVQVYAGQWKIGLGWPAVFAGKLVEGPHLQNIAE